MYPYKICKSVAHNQPDAPAPLLLSRLPAVWDKSSPAVGVDRPREEPARMTPLLS
jgi:hypothetical protein